MKEHTKYIERDDLKCATHIEVKVYYSKGGVTYLSGATSPRGYYLSVRPVSASGDMIRFGPFNIRKRLLFETKRFTEKQFAKAIEMAKGFEDELIAAVVAKNKAA